MTDVIDTNNNSTKPSEETNPTTTKSTFLIEQDVSLKCRFYEEEYPGTDDVVIARVTKIAEMGAYAQLLEYNNIEGMILMSELSRRRIRSVNKLVKVGKDEYVVVLRADTVRSYIDLSKRRATPDCRAAADNRYQKAKRIHSIIRHTAKQLKFETNEQLESLMRRAVWYFDSKYKKAEETQKASYDYFKRAVDDPSVFDECDLTAEEKSMILKNINNNMMPSPDKIRADIKVSCSGPDGVHAVKTALKAGIHFGKQMAIENGLIKPQLNTIDENEASGDSDLKKDNKKLSLPLNQLSITLIAPPEYVVILHTLDKEKGIKIVKESLNEIQRKIEEFSHGGYQLKDEARVVGKKEDEQLIEALKRATDENKQVAGDSDDEEGS